MPKRKRDAAPYPIRAHEHLTTDASELITHLDRAMRQLVLAGEKGDEPSKRFRRSEIAVIDTLGAQGPTIMGLLAARVRLPHSTATRIVDGLVSNKMAERERLHDNRRVVQVKLAAVGLRFYRRALRNRIVAARRMLRKLDRSERRELVRLIRKIADSVSAGPNE
jgi:DNA-binding MarR family transcriptional regulator